jgi:hypothetical protein
MAYILLEGVFVYSMEALMLQNLKVVSTGTPCEKKLLRHYTNTSFSSILCRKKK